MNEHQIIEILIAYWPLVHLEIHRLLPLSSLLFNINNQQQDDEIDSIAKYLEKKLPDGSTLLDYIVMGLVNKHKTLSHLKIVDFHRCSSSKIEYSLDYFMRNFFLLRYSNDKRTFSFTIIMDCT